MTRFKPLQARAGGGDAIFVIIWHLVIYILACSFSTKGKSTSLIQYLDKIL